MLYPRDQYLKLSKCHEAFVRFFEKIAKEKLDFRQIIASLSLEAFLVFLNTVKIVHCRGNLNFLVQIILFTVTSFPMEIKTQTKIYLSIYLSIYIIIIIIIIRLPTLLGSAQYP